MVDLKAEALHRAIYHCDLPSVKSLLETEKEARRTALVNSQDVRSHSPLHLAVLNNWDEGAQYLLANGATPKARTDDYNFSSIQYSIFQHNRELVSKMIEIEYQKAKQKIDETGPAIKNCLLGIDDFYVEIDWKFSTYIPLVGKFLPQDTWKVYKKGNMARVDISLVDFKNMRWEHGHISFVVKPDDTNEKDMRVHLIDYKKKTRYNISKTDNSLSADFKSPAFQKSVSLLLQTPIQCPQIHWNKIRVEPKTSFFGHPKFEYIDEIECQVFKLNNFQLSMASKSDHIPEEVAKEQKRREEIQKNLFKCIMEKHSSGEDYTEEEEKLKELDEPIEVDYPTVPPLNERLTEIEYFDKTKDLQSLDGKVSKSKYKFSASMTVHPTYNLKLDELVPLFEALITFGEGDQDERMGYLLNLLKAMDITKGFPVHMEIPLWQVVWATIKFQNLKRDGKLDDSLFDIPNFELRQMAKKKSG